MGDAKFSWKVKTLDESLQAKVPWKEPEEKAEIKSLNKFWWLGCKMWLPWGGEAEGPLVARVIREGKNTLEERILWKTEEKIMIVWLSNPLRIFWKEKAHHEIRSDQISLSVVSDSLQPHESQHARPPCPSPTPGVHSDSRPSSQWCHSAISSSVIPYSSCPQSLPASEPFPMSQLFAWGGQSTGVSALASFLPKKSQGRSLSEWTGWRKDKKRKVGITAIQQKVGCLPG